MAMSEVAEEVRTSLLKADEAWSKALGDREAFAESISPDAYFLPPDVPRVQGREAFLAAGDSLVEMNLTWSADVAEVSAGGDLGFTIGTFRITVDGPDGRPIERVGKYKTVWQRRDDGRWWVVADTFNFDAPMPASGQ